jgi:hypothetical protein
MSQSIAQQVSKINTTATLSATQTTIAKAEAATKDAGRVHVGGSMIRF